MIPDFSTKTIETLGKRAGYLCSNPDCRKATIGPGETQNQTTSIGEAAHIFGARMGAARHDPEMSDVARAESTNGIWLCRNCHKTVDQNSERFPSRLLFAWREKHEEYVISTIGTRSEKLQDDIITEELEPFLRYPLRIQRIVRDKPDGWKLRLAAEILRHQNQPLFQKLRDIKAGLYNRPSDIVNEQNIADWLETRIQEMMALIPAFEPLLSELNTCVRNEDDHDNIIRIHQVCILLHEAIGEVVDFEERVQQAILPTNYDGVNDVIATHLGNMVHQLEEIPDFIDDGVRRAIIHQESGGSEPLAINKTYIFDLPSGWSDHTNLVRQHLADGNIPPTSNVKMTSSEFANNFSEGIKGFYTLFVIGFIIYLIFF